MFKAVLFALLIPLTCLAQNNQVQDPCHFHNLQTETTPLGKTIDYRRINDSLYHIYYGQEDSLRRVPGEFYCDSPSTGRPSLYAENEQFIFLSNGCGTACRIGQVLPLAADLEIKVLPHWLTYDLDKNIIVSMDYGYADHSIFIKLMRLGPYKESVHKAPISCDYGIPIDCFKNVEIMENKVVVNWTEEIKAPPFEIPIRNQH